jgi:hypothetical protein
MPYDAVIASKASDGEITILRKIPKSDKPAKVLTNAVESGTILGVPTVRMTYGAPLNLPEPQDNVKNIVLPIVAQAEEEASRKRDIKIVQKINETIPLSDKLKALIGGYLGSSFRNDLIGMDTNRAIRNKENAIVGSPAFVLFSTTETAETSAPKQTDRTATAVAGNEKAEEAAEVTQSFVNLTPHAIDIAEIVEGQLKKKMVIPPSGTVTRLDAETIPSGDIEGIPAVRIRYGKVSQMPASKAGVTYIVSMLIGQALQGIRDDLVSPDMGTVQYDPDKKIFGVLRLIRY